jgi:hypothetical protein
MFYRLEARATKRMSRGSAERENGKTRPDNDALDDVLGPGVLLGLLSRREDLGREETQAHGREQFQ